MTGTVGQDEALGIAVGFYLFIGVVTAIIVLVIKVARKSSSQARQPSEPATQAKNEIEATYTTPYNFEKRSFIMTRTEQDFYRRLFQVFGRTYLIYPQVHLSTLLDHRQYHQNWKAALATIQRKSVDYVFCTTDFRIVVAIELDDISHDTEDRQRRDYFVNEICQKAGLPLVRFRNGLQLSDDELRDRIQNSIVVK